VDTLQSKWATRSQDYVKRYGEGVLQDREFIKANRDTYTSILKSLPYKDLSFDEKISYRIMRGQVRHLNRVLYPNRLIRSVRAVLASLFRFGGNLLRTSFRVLNTLLASMTGTQGIQVNTRRRPAVNRSLINPIRQATAHNGTESRPQTDPSMSQSPNGHEPLKQNRRDSHRVVQMDTHSQGQHI